APVPPAGFEPAAYRLGGGRSVHLSYEGAPSDGSRGGGRSRHPGRAAAGTGTDAAGRARARRTDGGDYTWRSVAPTVRSMSYARQPSYGGAPQPHPQGTTVLVLGILGVVLCGILAPVAWVMGSNALSEIDRNPSAYSNRGTVQAGMILGIVGTALWILGIVVAFAV